MIKNRKKKQIKEHFIFECIHKGAVVVIEVKSNAKINLGLNIIGKTENGYHLLDMIMVPISLSDNMTIDFKGVDGSLKIKTNLKWIPVGEDNIVYKIYNLFYKETNLEKLEIELYLEKIVPSQAGLGGGSSNGAFFFNELNKYYGNPVTLERAIEITKDVGADIPFFLVNKPSRIGGIGEGIDIIDNNIEEKIILIKPNFGVSTVVAYKNYSKLKERKSANIEKIITNMKSGNLDQIENSIENSLEQGLLLEDRKIIGFRKRLEKLGDLKFFMSGSGSCYYTFVKEEDIDLVYKKIETTMGNCKIEICSFL
jgi:4-diphosphocytidyl-2-C-methyl-D-erythritol kinase